MTQPKTITIDDTKYVRADSVLLKDKNLDYTKPSLKNSKRSAK